MHNRPLLWAYSYTSSWMNANIYRAAMKSCHDYTRPTNRPPNHYRICNNNKAANTVQLRTPREMDLQWPWTPDVRAQKFLENNDTFRTLTNRREDHHWPGWADGRLNSTETCGGCVGERAMAGKSENPSRSHTREAILKEFCLPHRMTVKNNIPERNIFKILRALHWH